MYCGVKYSDMYCEVRTVTCIVVWGEDIDMYCGVNTVTCIVV